MIFSYFNHIKKFGQYKERPAKWVLVFCIIGKIKPELNVNNFNKIRKRLSKIKCGYY